MCFGDVNDVTSDDGFCQSNFYLKVGHNISHQTALKGAGKPHFCHLSIFLCLNNPLDIDDQKVKHLIIFTQ